jgi:hypothetical protein
MDVNHKTMNHSKLLLLLSTLFVAFAVSPVLGQSTLSSKSITISIVNKRFDNAIKQIQEESKINLCYNSDIIPKNKIVTVKANHNRLDKVLVPLLASVNLQMKEINDQIIITKAPTVTSEESKFSSPKNTESTTQKTEILGKIVSILDTVYYTVHDTIVKTVFDTIRVTVYDTRVIKQINKAISWTPNFYVDLSCGMLYQISKNIDYSQNSVYHSFFEQYGKSLKNQHGYSISSNFTIRNKRWELSGGIEFFQLTNTLNNTDIPKSIGRIDSTIIGVSIKPDGIFYTYKVDTTTLGIIYDPNKTTFKNNVIYVGIPVTLSYKIVQTHKIEIGLSLGVIYSRLITSKGFDANLSNGDKLFKNTGGESMIRNNVSFIAGFEIDYPVSDHISLSALCRYRKNILSTYQKSFPLLEKPSYIYPGLALKYKF